MFPNSLDKKPIFVRPDKIEIKDLTSPMFDIRSNKNISYTVYKIPKEYEMRPDLIAGAVYNNSLYAEYILKFNGISNPFSIKEGDIILIPSLDSMRAIISKPSGTDVDGAKSLRNSYKYIDPLKIPKFNNTFSNRQIIGGAKEGALPPNIAEEEEPQITYRNGRVYFGTDVGTCLENGMTQSEFLTTVIKSKKV
jgi:hypothetical protein